MIELIAMGAAIIGGLVAESLSSSSSSSGSSKSSTKQASATPQSVSPQSYIVTPMGGGAGNTPMSAVDAVNKFIV